MKPTDDLVEHERIGLLVARKTKLLSAVAQEGYEEHGRGAVLYSERWEHSHADNPPFYLPSGEREFNELGADIHRAVASYQPMSEGVVVVLSRNHEVYVARLKLPLNEAVATQMH